ncbi:MAG TPA: MaoC family dehydratase [Candidatus Methylomirabilis sp.]|nr:MaoC family dehydratase [Candidatus Methylomirabilis sp.]
MSDLVYFEDVAVGEVHRFGRYPVTAEEVVEYARQFDPQPFHVDDEAARQSMFGGLIASGWHTGAMFIHMLCEHAIPGAATTGALGFDDLRWLKPVRPGDVLGVETTIREKVASRSRRDIGVVKVDSRVLNQNDEAVMTLTSLVLYRRRPLPPAETTGAT